MMNSLIKEIKYRENTYPVCLKWDIFNYKDLIIDAEKVRNWCKEGCPNYNKNGGCPPFSPSADEVFLNKTFILLTCKIETSRVNIGNPEEKLKLIDEILCTYMDEVGYRIKNMLTIDFLNPSHCRGCDVCSFKTGCKQPNRRVFSITGTGILLSDTIEKLFKEKLLWMKDGKEPPYIIKIMAFIDPRENEIEKLNKNLANYL